MTQQTSPIDRLNTILDATAQAIRAGNLPMMGDLAVQTENALAMLGRDADPARIAALRDKASRNATGLEAAAKGVRAARRRLHEVISAQSGVQTYDNAGKARKIGGPDTAIKARF